MGQVSRYIPAPYGGISQAPPLARQPEQAEILEDCMVAIPQGATKRPPFSGQCVLANHPSHTNGLFEVIERDGNADVILTVTNEAGVVIPRVYNLSGLPQPYTGASYPSQAITIQAGAQAYLNYGNPNPSTDLSVLTVEDYTFIINRLVPVDILRTSGVPQKSATRPKEAMLWVRSGQYGKSYKVTVTPVSGTPVTVLLHTPNGSSAPDNDWIATDVIADALTSGSYSYAPTNGASISGNLSALTSQGFTVTRTNSVIYISHPSINFTMNVADGQDSLALVAIKDEVRTFADLPKVGVNGFIVKITQNTGNTDDDYYVSFVETVGPGTGTWKEVLGPGAELGIDPATMPVGLFNDGSWKLNVLGWKSRTVGDELLAKDPDFVGQTISDLSFWRGRLAVVSGEGISLSAADDPFRFYPKTLTTIVASDPVSLISPYPNISKLRYGIPFDSRLIGFGDIAQVQVTSNGEVSIENTSIDVMTAYEFLTTARPQPSNGKLYFLAPHGENYATVYELAVDKVRSVTDADDLSADAPRYVPKGVDRVANCAVNYTIVYGQSGDTALYPHLFRHRDQQRVQNAFQRWHLPAGYKLGGMFFRNTKLYVLASDPVAGRAAVLMADISPANKDPDATSTILTHLDWRVKEDQVSLTYDSATSRTKVVLPFPRSSLTRATVRAPGGLGGRYIGGVLLDKPEGYLIPIATDQTGAGAYEVWLEGDWRTCPLWVGYQYEARWRPTRIYAVTQDGTPLRSGRLSLRRMAVDVADTGFLRVDVRAGGRVTRSTYMSGYRWDDPNSLYDTPPNFTGPFRVPLLGENEQVTIDFVNDSHFPSQILGFEWRGELNTKAARI